MSYNVKRGLGFFFVVMTLFWSVCLDMLGSWLSCVLLLRLTDNTFLTSTMSDMRFHRFPIHQWGLQEPRSFLHPYFFSFYLIF